MLIMTHRVADGMVAGWAVVRFLDGGDVYDGDLSAGAGMRGIQAGVELVSTSGFTALLTRLKYFGRSRDDRKENSCARIST